MAGPPTQPPARILVVRLGAIGDCLRVMPALARLRRGFPGAGIGWLVESPAASLLRDHPLLDRVHVLDRRRLGSGAAGAVAEVRRVVREVRQERYELTIDFHARLKSGLITRASGAPRRIGFGVGSGSEANFLFTNEHVTLRDRAMNRVERFLALLAPLGLDTGWNPAEPGLPRDTGAEARATAWHEAAGSPQIALFAGTSAHRSGDRWPVEKWKALVPGLSSAGRTSMVLWGPGDEAMARAIAAAGGGPCTAAPATTLPEMLALLGRFRLYVGTNTAAMHMAWMQGVPCVVLTGGRPWRTDRPLAPVASAMLSAGGVEPIRKLRGEAERRAIEEIAVEDVLAAVQRLL